MKSYKMVLLIVFLLCFSQTSFGQEELTETLDYQGEFSIQHPAGWVTDIGSANPILANSQETLDAGASFEPLPEGSLYIGVFLPDDNATDIGIPMDSEPMDALRIFLSGFGFAVEAAQSDAFEIPAAEADDTSHSIFPYSVHFLALQTETGTIIYAVIYDGDYADVEPLVNAIVATGVFTPDEVIEGFTNVIEREMDDVSLRMTYPDEWLTTTVAIGDGEIIVIASSEDALTAAEEYQEVPEGDVAITLLTPDFLQGTFGLPDTIRAAELLSAMNADIDSDDASVDSYLELRYDAYITFVDGESSAPDDTILIAVEYPVGTTLFFVQYGGDFAEIEPTIVQILNSAIFMAGISPAETPEVEE